MELGVNADVKTRAITDQVLLVGVVKSLAQEFPPVAPPPPSAAVGGG